jgi:hypothetical protein
MTPIRPTEGLNELAAQVVRFPDFEISHACEGPGEVICLGSEDGKLRITGIDKTDWQMPFKIAWQVPFKIVESGEAINSIAFTNDLIAASTRSDLGIWKRRHPSEDVIQHTFIDGGAHEVVATSSGGFIASQGVQGLLSLVPGDQGLESVPIRAKDKQINFYKLRRLGGIEHGDIFISAARGDGLVTLAGTQLRMRTIPEIDVIDVCPLVAEPSPHALAALGIDRSLHFIRDVWNDPRSKPLRFHGLCGTAYRVLSAQGHLFMLTSEKLYLFKDLASRFLRGESVNEPTVIKVLDLQAVDASIAFGQWLLVVMPDGLTLIDIEQWVKRGNEDTNPSLRPDLHSEWQDLPQNDLAVASISSQAIL